jgi:hypothetical protein
MPTKSPSFLDEWLSKRSKSAAPSLKAEKAEIEKEQREQLGDSAPRPSNVIKPTEFSRQEETGSDEPKEEKHENRHHKKHSHEADDHGKHGAPKTPDPKHEDKAREEVIVPQMKQPETPPQSEVRPKPAPPAPKPKDPAPAGSAPQRLEDELSHGDTIYIDQEGNMHVGGQKPDQS